jgi:hypothetical protein
MVQVQVVNVDRAPSLPAVPSLDTVVVEMDTLVVFVVKRSSHRAAVAAAAVAVAVVDGIQSMMAAGCSHREEHCIVVAGNAVGVAVDTEVASVECSQEAQRPHVCLDSILALPSLSQPQNGRELMLSFVFQDSQKVCESAGIQI